MRKHINLTGSGPHRCAGRHGFGTWPRRATAREVGRVETKASSPRGRLPFVTTRTIPTSRRPHTAPTLAAAAVLALSPTSGPAQQVVEIEDRIACPGCAIETGPPVTLVPPRDHVYFTSLPPPVVARDREGNYIVAPVGGDALFAVFGADGRFRSSYGGLGEGPGEFAAIPIAMAVGEADVLYASDLRNLYTLAPSGRARAGSGSFARFRECRGGSEEWDRGTGPASHGGRNHDSSDPSVGRDHSGKHRGRGEKHQ